MICVWLRSRTNTRGVQNANGRIWLLVLLARRPSIPRRRLPSPHAHSRSDYPLYFSFRRTVFAARASATTCMYVSGDRAPLHGHSSPLNVPPFPGNVFSKVRRNRRVQPDLRRARGRLKFTACTVYYFFIHLRQKSSQNRVHFLLQPSNAQFFSCY